MVPNSHLLSPPAAAGDRAIFTKLFLLGAVPRHTCLPWLLTQTNAELKLRGTQSPPTARTQHRGRAAHSPGMQMHWNSPIWSRQVASFWQGLERHSLTSISQRGPE